MTILGLVLALIYGCCLLQRGEQVLGGVWHRNGLIKNDGLCAYVLAVETLICAIVRTKSRTFQRNAGEQSTSAGVGENLCAQRDVGFRGCIAAYRASSGRSIPTELHFTAENAGCGTRAHEKQ